VTNAMQPQKETKGRMMEGTHHAAYLVAAAAIF
jgi:hypothetical protein